jgi:hypothetical protein
MAFSVRLRLRLPERPRIVGATTRRHPAGVVLGESRYSLWTRPAPSLTARERANMRSEVLMAPEVTEKHGR